LHWAIHWSLIIVYIAGRLLGTEAHHGTNTDEQADCHHLRHERSLSGVERTCIQATGPRRVVPSKRFISSSDVTEQEMPARLSLSDWDELTEHMRRFGATGTVTADDEHIHVDFGSADIELSRDGTLRTGMPLHDFAQDDTAAVMVNHDAGTLTVDADGVDYTFRRPGR
jgi:hypothetical protein